MPAERFQLGDYWLSQRPNSPAWCRTWFDTAIRQTRRASLGTNDLERAKVALAEWYVKYANLKDAQPDDVLVETVMARYYDKHGRSLPSHETAKRATNIWTEYWTDRTVADLTVEAQEDFQRALLERKLSLGYIRRVLGVGKAALNRAHERGEIVGVPFVKLPEDGAVFEHVATVKQLRAMLVAIPKDHHLWPYCLIRLNTACRGDAARDLAPAQVDAEHGIVRLNPAGRPQTRKRRPDVPLTSTLREALVRLPTRSGPYVAWNGQPVDSVKTAWRAMVSDAGLTGWFVPKVLRHTVATELRRRGVSGWEVSALLGHTRGDAAATTGRYAKYAPEWMGASKDAMDDLMHEIAKGSRPLRELARYSR